MMSIMNISHQKIIREKDFIAVIISPAIAIIAGFLYSRVLFYFVYSSFY